MTNTMLPARIHLQIREGKLNTLSEFEVEVRKSTPEDDGTTTHEVSNYDIIRGLATALREEIVNLRGVTSVPEDAEQWLAAVRDWIFE